MTRQDEIRKGLKPFWEAAFPIRCPNCEHLLGKYVLTEQAIFYILSYLASQGAVLKVEKELPATITNQQMAAAYGGYDFLTADMRRVCKAEQEHILDAGYKATEPLIKEESDGASS